MQDLIVLRQVLTASVPYRGWLYVRAAALSLDTECFFYVADLELAPVDEASVRADFAKQGWRVTLAAAEIEDVLDNTNAQLEQPNLTDYLAAFEFYLVQDAFKEWD